MPLDPLTLLEMDDPITLEARAGRRRRRGQALTLPAAVCGRFDRPGDVDVYTFKGRAGEVVAVDLVCERMQRPGDPVVIVSDGRGRELAVLDDQGSNRNALTQLNRDPAGVVTLPEEGAYRVTVLERFRKGGTRYSYVLRLGPPRPDFAPVICHENNDPSCPLVRQGGSAFLEVTANRREGFEGQVTVEAHGLPRGVSCPPVAIGPRAEQAALVFTAAPDAPDWSGFITLTARAEIGGRRVEREVACVQRRWGESVNGQPNLDNASRVCRQVGLAVRPRAPYGMSLTCRISRCQGGRRHDPDREGIRPAPLARAPGPHRPHRPVITPGHRAGGRRGPGQGYRGDGPVLDRRGRAGRPIYDRGAGRGPGPVRDRPGRARRRRGPWCVPRAPRTPLVVEVATRPAELKKSAASGSPAPKGG